MPATQSKGYTAKKVQLLTLALTTGALVTLALTAVSTDATGLPGSSGQSKNSEAESLKPNGIRITVQDVILRVLEDNYNIKSLGLAVKMAATEVMFEKGAFDPVLFGEASYSSQNYPVSDILTGMRTEKIHGKAGVRKKMLPGTELELGTEGNKLLTDAPVYFMRPEYRQKFYLDVVQPLLRGAGIDANAARIRLTRAQAEQEAQSSREKLIDALYKALESYWDLYRAQEMLGAAMDGLQMAEKLYQDTKLRRRHGIAPESDTYQAFAEVHRRIADVIRARQNTVSADAGLKHAMSIQPESTLWNVPFRTDLPAQDNSSPSIDEKALMDMAMKYNPKIMAAAAGITGAEATRKWARNNKLPKLDFQAGVAFHGLSGDEKPDAAAQGYPTPDKFRGGYAEGYDNIFSYPEWHVGFKFEMPIPNRAAKAKYDKATYGLAKARLDERAAIIDAYASTRDLAPRITALWSEVNARNASVRYKKRQVDDETYKLMNGMGTTYDVLKMQAEYVEERGRKADATAEYMKSLAEVMKLTGVVVLDPHRIYEQGGNNVDGQK